MSKCARSINGCFIRIEQWSVRIRFGAGESGHNVRENVAYVLCRWTSSHQADKFIPRLLEYWNVAPVIGTDMMSNRRR